MMKRKLQKTDLDQMEQRVFKWKCDKGIVFVNGVLVRENSRTIWEKRKSKRVRGLRRAIVDVRNKKSFYSNML